MWKTIWFAACIRTRDIDLQSWVPFFGHPVCICTVLSTCRWYYCKYTSVCMYSFVDVSLVWIRIVHLGLYVQFRGCVAGMDSYCTLRSVCTVSWMCRCYGLVLYISVCSGLSQLLRAIYRARTRQSRTSHNYRCQLPTQCNGSVRKANWISTNDRAFAAGYRLQTGSSGPVTQAYCTGLLGALCMHPFITWLNPLRT